MCIILLLIIFDFHINIFELDIKSARLKVNFVKNETMKISKIWFITGASQGLGLAMVKYLLEQGQVVIATTRDKNKFDPVLLVNPKLRVIELDLHSEQAVIDAIKNVITDYGRIDVLVNNAGHGFVGAVEEANEQEIKEVLAVNVLATLRIIRAVVPSMRKLKSGHIINMSSMAGLSSSPGWGIYNLSKYAVEGLSEALYYELKDLNVKVSVIEPGAFRTGFLGDSLAVAKQTIDDYSAIIGSFKSRLQENNGKQPGNPEMAAAAVYDLVEMDNPPLRLLLGGDAYMRATQKIELLQDDFERMKSITLSVGFNS